MFLFCFCRPITGPLRTGFPHALPGPVYQLHIGVQHGDEGLLHRLFHRHRVSHVHEVQGHLRPQPRHLQVINYLIRSVRGRCADDSTRCFAHKCFLIISAQMSSDKLGNTCDNLNALSRIEFLLIPVALLSMVLNHEFSVMEVLWTFSIYLESVAILPQLFMVSKTGEAESITSHYLFALGAYRGLYIFNWIYRYQFEGRKAYFMLPTDAMTNDFVFRVL